MTSIVRRMAASRETGRVPRGVTAGITECGRDAACAKRLEDVEKIVRELRDDVDALHEFVLQCQDFILGRVEALEADQVQGVILRRRGDASDGV